MPKIKERLSSNPFMEEFGKQLERGTYNAVGKVQDELIYSNGHPVKLSVEEEKESIYDPRYYARLPENGIDTIMQLTSSSHKLFYWILKNLKMHAETITLYAPAIQQALGYKSINSIYLAVQGLMDANMLAPEVSGTWSYYINPVVFYKGNLSKTWYVFNKNKKEIQKGSDIRYAWGDARQMPINHDFIKPTDELVYGKVNPEILKEETPVSVNPIADTTTSPLWTGD